MDILVKREIAKRMLVLAKWNLPQNNLKGQQKGPQGLTTFLQK